MKIFRLDFDVNNYKSVQLCERVNAEFYQMFDGTRLWDKWETLKVKYYDDDKDLRYGDAPGFIIPAINKKALDALFPLIKNDVELLSFQLNDEKIYGINVLTIIDAIDYELSQYRTYRDGNRIMAFKKYVFRDEAIEKHNIFKIIDLPRGEIFVSEEFYKAILDNELEGFKLELVYTTSG